MPKRRRITNNLTGETKVIDWSSDEAPTESQIKTMFEGENPPTDPHNQDVSTYSKVAFQGPTEDAKPSSLYDKVSDFVKDVPSKFAHPIDNFQRNVKAIGFNEPLLPEATTSKDDYLPTRVAKTAYNDVRPMSSPMNLAIGAGAIGTGMAIPLAAPVIAGGFALNQARALPQQVSDVYENPSAENMTHLGVNAVTAGLGAYGAVKGVASRFSDVGKSAVRPELDLKLPKSEPIVETPPVKAPIAKPVETVQAPPPKLTSDSVEQPISEPVKAFTPNTPKPIETSRPTDQTVGIEPGYPAAEALVNKGRIIGPNELNGPDASPLDKLAGGLREAGALRKTQEEMYTKERGVRIQKFKETGEKTFGQAGAQEQMSQMSGPMQRVNFEGTANALNPDEINNLFETIKSSSLSPFEQVKAYTGLTKLLNGSEVPQQGEINVLGTAFGRDFMASSGLGSYYKSKPFEYTNPLKPNESVSQKGLYGPDDLPQFPPHEYTSPGEKVSTSYDQPEMFKPSDLTDSRSQFTKAKGVVSDVTGLSRAVMTSLDVSAPFKQGAFLQGRPAFREAFKPMFEALKSEEGARAVRESIEADPNYALGKNSGLAITELGDNIRNREEAFQSRYSDKLPILAQSGRAHTAFLNYTRMKSYSSIIDEARKSGLMTPELPKELANYINNASGRGNLSSFDSLSKGINQSFEKIAPEMGNALFSPKLLASRLNLMNPAFYINASPVVRQAYLSDLMHFATINNVLVNASKAAQLANTSYDPREADFGKIKVGNTRLDPWGGFQQPIVAASRMMDFMSSYINGNVKDFGEFKKPDAKEAFINFMSNKESPMGSLVDTLMTGKEKGTGKPISVPKEVLKRYTFMIAQDAYDLINSDPKLLPLLIPASLGYGLQTYPDKVRKMKDN